MLKLCSYPRCDLKICMGEAYIDHIKQAHPGYCPRSFTLSNFNVKKCKGCNEIVCLNHHCIIENDIKKKNLEFPSSQKYSTYVDISWTVSAMNDTDISDGIYKSVCSIIDEYFEYGIACTERGIHKHYL